MVRLRVRRLAEDRGLNLSTFQREAKLPTTTARRIWFGTSNGKPNGPLLEYVAFATLETLADFFQTGFDGLMERVPDQKQRRGTQS